MIETKFKNTEVGKIPEDWNVRALRECIDYLRTGLNPRVHFKLNTPDATGYYITVRELQGFDIVLSKQTDRINHQAVLRITERSNLKIGDVLFSGTGTIGQTALVKKTPTDWGIKEGIYAITPNHKELDSNYLIFYLHSTIAVSAFSMMTTGSTIGSVPMAKLQEMRIPLPPLSEQKRIATVLSNVDALISELDKLIEKKRAIKQGAMQQLLTGKIRLRGFSEPWVEVKLGEVCEVKRGVRVTRELLASEGEYPVYQNTNYPLGFFDKYNVSANTPFVIIGGSAGLVGLSKTNYWAADDCAYFTNCKRIDKNFLYYDLLLRQGEIKRHVRTASVPRLDRKNIEELELQIPSLSEQSAIATALSSMDDEIVSLEAKREKYIAIKQGMMQQLLTGKIRLVETAVKTKATIANVHFRRSVLAAEIADRLCEEPTFGHVKMEKILFLTERLCHIDIGSHYHRDAAGPYDNNALRSIDSQLKKQKWFEVQHTEKGNRYVPMQDRGKHKTYFDRYYSDVVPTFEKIINTFKTQRTEQCEIVATLYSAWEDLLHSNKPFTDADIVNEVLNNWHESKKRISQDRWLSAIRWMRENGFAPDMSVYKN